MILVDSVASIVTWFVGGGEAAVSEGLPVAAPHGAVFPAQPVRLHPGHSD